MTSDAKVARPFRGDRTKRARTATGHHGGHAEDARPPWARRPGKQILRRVARGAFGELISYKSNKSHPWGSGQWPLDVDRCRRWGTIGRVAGSGTEGVMRDRGESMTLGLYTGRRVLRRGQIAATSACPLQDVKAEKADGRHSAVRRRRSRSQITDCYLRCPRHRCARARGRRRGPRMPSQSIGLGRREPRSNILST